MARIWFVRARGEGWVSVDRSPAFERPLRDIVFPLDLGPHRRLEDTEVVTLGIEGGGEPERVVVEVTADDLAGERFSAFAPGLYDSPYSPEGAARRLARGGRGASGG